MIGVCSVDGCDGPVVSRGWCKMHYSRWWKHGDLSRARVVTRTCAVEGCGSPHACNGYCAVHNARISAHGTADLLPRATLAERFWCRIERADNGCWLWVGQTTFGYGYLTVQHRPARAHRVAYELLVEPIPEGLTLDHLAENIRRGAARITHCVHGHAFDVPNTGYSRKGRRVCRACARDRYHAKRAAARLDVAA